jgi:hypothetical protein
MAEFLDLFFKLILGFGIAGLFVLAILDSTIFFFLPFAVDTVLIVLVSRNHESMPVYAIADHISDCSQSK